MSETSLEGHVHRGCGGLYEQVVERVTIRFSGMSAEVERALFRCPRCGEGQSTLEQREAAERAAIDAIRAQHGLLEPKEIRALRSRLKLTSAQLSELVYGTPKGIIEGWERGRYVQNVEADRLLRSLDDPEVLQQRAARIGLTLPDPTADAHPQEEDSPSEASAEDGSTAEVAAAESASEPSRHAASLDPEPRTPNPGS